SRHSSPCSVMKKVRTERSRPAYSSSRSSSSSEARAAVSAFHQLSCAFGKLNMDPEGWIRRHTFGSQPEPLPPLPPLPVSLPSLAGVSPPWPPVSDPAPP